MKLWLKILFLPILVLLTLGGVKGGKLLGYGVDEIQIVQTKASSSTLAQIIGINKQAVVLRVTATSSQIGNIQNWESPTSTVAYITNNGDFRASGTLFGSALSVSGSGTTTFSGGVQATVLNLTSNTASSTFANGIRLNGGCFLNVDGTCAGSGGANTALSNLASVAINLSLLPGTNNSIDLGGSGFSFRNIFASGTAYLGHTISAGNNLYDLGSPTSSWRDIYASGTIRAGSLDITSTSATTTIAGHLAIQGNTRLGDATTDLIDVTGRFSTSLLPTQNNTVDLGSAAVSWRNIYASGTLYGITSTSTITLSSSYAPATGTNGNLKDFIMPFNCTIGEIVMNATSTVGIFPTIIDVNRMTSMGIGTTTLYTTQTSRPQLGAGGLTTSTVPQVTSLTKGNVVNFDIDQYGGHGGLDVQIICAKRFSN